MADSRQNNSTNPMDQWDELFENDDPTRVLSPQEFEDSPVSHQTAAVSQSEEKTKIISPVSQPSPLYIDESAYENIYEEEQARPEEYVYEEQTLASRYNRLQLLPCFLGWLISYAVLQLGTTCYRYILESFGARDFGVVGNLLPAVQKNAAEATPWLFALGLIIFLAYGAGGYAACRMARYAAFKQGLGVFCWGLLATIVASLFVLLAQPEGKPIVSYQHLANNNFDTGLIGVLAFFALAFISSGIGAILGKRFEYLHKK